MFLWLRHLVLISILLITEGLAIPKPEDKTRKVYDNLLSDEDHYGSNEEHNIEYDHEAFLGENEAKSFDELTPEESKIRLSKIVDKIDSDKDGYVSMQELKEWIQYSQKRYILDDADQQWKSLNFDNKEKFTWDEYKKLTYGYMDGSEEENSFQYKDMMDRDLRRWKKADKDNDGDLTKDEFIDFVHPEEADHMKDIVVIETMEDIDKDKDGKISIDEYIGDMYGDNDLDEEEPDWLQNERDQFSQFRDKDKSGYMDYEEVRSWILPDGYDNSEAEAKHLIYESDVNRDNQLSKEEILNKYDLFVGSQATDFGKALERHDEF